MIIYGIICLVYNGANTPIH